MDAITTAFLLIVESIISGGILTRKTQEIWFLMEDHQKVKSTIMQSSLKKLLWKYIDFLRQEVKHEKIAKEFGISRRAVGFIANKQRWAHIHEGAL